MSMKKILMAAAAVTALTAGSASAAEISAATVSGIALTVADATGAIATNYSLASSAILNDSSGAGIAVNNTTSATTDITGKLSGTGVVFDPGAGGSTTYSATYTLSGTAGASFSSAVNAGTITIIGAGTGCLPTGLNTVAGGAVGTSSVTAVFTVPGTGTGACAPSGTNVAPNAIKFTAPFKISTPGTVVGTVSFKVVATDSAFNGAGGSHTLVKTATPYDVAVDADTGGKATTLALASSTQAAYTYLKTGGTNDLTIGKLTVQTKSAPSGTQVATDAPESSPTTSAKVYADMARTLLPAITYDAKIDALTSNFGIIKPNLTVPGGTLTDMPLATPTASTSTRNITAAGATTVGVTIAGTNTTAITSAQAFSATLTPSIGTSTKLTTPAAVTGALQTIGLEGVSFLAPWVGGSQSSSSTYIRVSNNGAATGQVTLSLLSPVYKTGTAAGATTCSSSQLSKLSSIGAGGELVINPDDLATCFGPFQRGDLSVALQSSSTAMTAKARNVTAATVSELSLGNGTFN